MLRKKISSELSQCFVHQRITELIRRPIHCVSGLKEGHEGRHQNLKPMVKEKEKEWKRKEEGRGREERGEEERRGQKNLRARVRSIWA